MYEWVPVVFVTFKAVIFVLCMFFAIKWHFDQGRKKGIPTRTLVRTCVLVGGGFVVAVIGILWLAFTMASRMGMDLSF